MTKAERNSIGGLVLKNDFAKIEPGDSVNKGHYHSFKNNSNTYWNYSKTIYETTELPYIN